MLANDGRTSCHHTQRTSFVFHGHNSDPIVVATFQKILFLYIGPAHNCAHKPNLILLCFPYITMMDKNCHFTINLDVFYNVGPVFDAIRLFKVINMDRKYRTTRLYSRSPI